MSHVRIRWKVVAHISNLRQAGLFKEEHWRGDLQAAKAFGLDFPSSLGMSSSLVRWLKPDLGWFKLNKLGRSL